MASSPLFRLSRKARKVRIQWILAVILCVLTFSLVNVVVLHGNLPHHSTPLLWTTLTSQKHNQNHNHTRSLQEKPDDTIWMRELKHRPQQRYENCGLDHNQTIQTNQPSRPRGGLRGKRQAVKGNKANTYHLSPWGLQRDLQAYFQQKESHTAPEWTCNTLPVRPIDTTMHPNYPSFRTTVQTPPTQLFNNSSPKKVQSLVLMVTATTSTQVRPIFVQLLKWLDLESTPTPTKEDFIIRVSRLYLLLSTSQLRALEQDVDYGHRILAWHDNPLHPVHIRHGSSFWDAAAQVDPTIQENNDSLEPLLVWLDASVGDNNRVNDGRSWSWRQWVQQELKNRGNQQRGNVERAPPQSLCNHSIASGTVTVPILHKIMIPWRGNSKQADKNAGNPMLCWLEHPLLGAIRKQTYTEGDWDLARVSAALWFTWLFQSITSEEYLTVYQRSLQEAQDDDKLNSILAYFGVFTTRR